MWVFTEIADWFETKRTRSDRILDDWVESSGYSQGAMIVAATTKGFTTFGAGFVDLLRLGDGVGKGTAGGLGQDALRVAAIFPVGKATQLLKSARGASVARVVVDTGGPSCFWVASAKAFAHTGQRSGKHLLATVEDLASALGMSMNGLWVIPNLSVGMQYLKQLGANVGKVIAVSDEASVIRMLRNDGSVVMVAVHVMKDGQVLAGHAIYVFRNAAGQVRFMDRTVGQVTSSGVQRAYTSLKEIAPAHGADVLLPIQAAVLENIFVKTVAHEAPRLLIPVLGVIATDDSQ